MAVFFNQATLSYNNTVTNSNTVTGEIIETLSIVKTALDTTYTQGDTLAYAISIINTGEADYTGVTVTDDLGAYQFDETTQLMPLEYVENSVRLFVNGGIQPDPRTPDSFMLLGYPISVMDIILTDEDNNTVLMFGDFKSAYRMFCRRDFGISFTDIGAGAFESDTLKAKGVERFDGRIFDKEALVIVRGLAVSPLTVSKSAESLSNDITEATLKNLTKAQLLELCDELEVAGMTNEKTKTEIVEAILAKINQSAEA